MTLDSGIGEMLFAAIVYMVPFAVLFLVLREFFALVKAGKETAARQQEIVDLLKR